jgi:hypothetical protein
MPGEILTTASSIMCPHGGTAILTTSNASVKAGGAPALLQSDNNIVAGCPFVIALKPSPCVRIQWLAGSARAQAGSPVLVQSSVGMCFSPEGLPQGVAIVVNTQPKVSAQ